MTFAAPTRLHFSTAHPTTRPRAVQTLLSVVLWIPPVFSCGNSSTLPKSLQISLSSDRRAKSAYSRELCWTLSLFVRPVIMMLWRMSGWLPRVKYQLVYWGLLRDYRIYMRSMLNIAGQGLLVQLLLFLSFDYLYLPELLAIKSLVIGDTVMYPPPSLIFHGTQ